MRKSVQCRSTHRGLRCSLEENHTGEHCSIPETGVVYVEDTVLAYCAGVIDSDGTIGVKRSTYAMRKVGDSTQPVYSERVCVKQVEPHAVDILHELFGGRRALEDPSAKRGRVLNSWQVTDRKAARCLRVLLPYIRIKRRQAENCLELRSLKEKSKVARVAKGRGHVGAAKRPSWISDAMERAYFRAKELNKVGT